MATTTIEWCANEDGSPGRVWNFVRGCRRVSPGCGGAAGMGGCYAELQANRFKGPGQPYEGLVALGKQGPRWTGAGRFVAEKLGEPLRWRPRTDGRRERVFVNSMSDLFFEEFTNEQIAAGFGVMAACPHIDFLILTKRPERMRDWFAWAAAQTGGALTTCCMAALDIEREYHPLGDGGPLHVKRCADPDGPWPLPNVWLGVSCEDQKRADERIPLLLECPAAVRFVSAEPLLGPITLRPWMGLECTHEDAHVEPDTNAVICRECDDATHLDWVIVGGESGPGARPCEVDWVRAIIAQCAQAGTACFVKQLGAFVGWTIDLAALRAGGPVELGPRLQDRKGGNPGEWPADLRVRQFPETRP